MALEAFRNKTGKDLYGYIGEDFKCNESNYASFALTWQEEHPQSLRAICPNLFDKMWQE